jgi:hypothetical protein
MTDTADLTAALRAHARGLHAREAAIELMLGHASWLRRTDFVDPFVHTATGFIDAPRWHRSTGPQQSRL